MNVALLGLGVMGAGMAGRLLEKGFPLAVYNRTRARADALAVRGARVAASPAEAASDASVVIAMLGDDAASRAVWLGPAGALGAAPAGAVLVECSTLSLDWVRELAGRAGERRLSLLDAPVGGSRGAAAAGALRLFIGGDAAALGSARPALEAIGNDLVHLGPSGAGAVMKLVNNLLGAVQAASLAEGLALAARAGLDLALAAELLASGGPGSGIVKSKAPRMARRDYGDTEFALRWMRKDASYALAAADALGVPMPTVAAARELYRMAGNRGLDDADFAAVLEAVRPPDA